MDSPPAIPGRHDLWRIGWRYSEKLFAGDDPRNVAAFMDELEELLKKATMAAGLVREDELHAHGAQFALLRNALKSIVCGANENGSTACFWCKALDEHPSWCVVRIARVALEATNAAPGA